jgi:hypothetical protein
MDASAKDITPGCVEFWSKLATNMISPVNQSQEGVTVAMRLVAGVMTFHSIDWRDVEPAVAPDESAVSWDSTLTSGLDNPGRWNRMDTLA